MGSTLDTTWKSWSMFDTSVIISPTADIPSPFRPRQPRADLVMQALAAVEPWQGSAGTCLTVFLAGEKFPLTVVPREGLAPEWYEHIGHHARVVQRSPFVRVKQPVLTSKLTVELVGPVSKPRLVRAYPGDYQPPLPWMGSAEAAPGGVERSIEYWREHAFVLTATNTVPEKGRGGRAPSWFTTC